MSRPRYLLGLCAALAAGGWISEVSMTRAGSPPLDRPAVLPEGAPPIDRRAVARIETATFALG